MKLQHMRELAMREALQRLYPRMPKEELLACAQRHARKTDIASPRELYLAAAATARHRHTDYERLVAGADEAGRQAARDATRPAIRAKLREWGGPDRTP